MKPSHWSSKAVELDRGNLMYRNNAANLLMMRNKLDDAERVLRGAQPFAKNAADSVMIAKRIEQIESIRKTMALEGTTATTVSTEVSDQGSAQSNGDVKTANGTTAHFIIHTTAANAPLKHPKEPPTGPKHVVLARSAASNAPCLPTLNSRSR